jgi:hypothetical protein
VWECVQLRPSPVTVARDWTTGPLRDGLDRIEVEAPDEDRQPTKERPLINRAAVTCLLARNYRFEGGFFAMSDEPFGKFEQYIIYSPPLFI